MRLNVWLTISLLGSLFLFSCNGKNDLHVVSKNFESEIELQQNLTFTLSKDVYPDSLLNIWDSSAFIEFTPEIKGRFKWNTSNEISFSPSEGFAPGTEYAAKLTNLLVKHSKKKYPVNGDIIKFHTAPLRVTSTHVSWTRGKNVSNVMVQLDMGFNYDVNLDEAARKLSLSSGGNNITIMAVNNGTGKVLSLQFTPLNDLDKETPLKIAISKGIPVVHSKYVSGQDTSFTSVIPSRYNLSITGLTAQHTGTEGIITINTSQPVMETNLKGLVSLEPKVPFSISLNDAGFTITSPQLSTTQTYQLNISSKLEGAFGGKMKGEYSEQVSFGKLKPSISFINTKGMYLTSAGNRNVAVSIVNVNEVEVSVVKVYENNLEQFLRNDKRYGYGYDGDNSGDGEEDGYRERESGEYNYYNTDNLGDVVFRQKYKTASLPKQSSTHILKLDFQDKIKDYNGVYVVCVQSSEHQWLQDSKIMSISDIGLIVKQEKDNMYVFANSIKNATPLSGVKISFISTNNQKMTTLTTDGDGVAAYKNISKDLPGNGVALVTAKMNDEFSMIWLNKTAISTSRFDVGGREPSKTDMNAMIYAERNLYRPGETIHVSAVVRNEKWKEPGEVPVKLKLIMPNGKEFATQRKVLNEGGSCEATFAMPATTITGTYTAQLFTGNDVLLNSYNISIEEFMPDRMKVSLKVNKPEFRPGEEVTASIQSDNLFGTPATDRNYQCELAIEKEEFSPKNFSDYNFDVINDFRFSNDMRTGKTDNMGGAKQVFKLDDAWQNTGLLKGTISTSVFDETGRPIHRYEHFKIYTQPVFIGIKEGDEYIGTKIPTPINIVAIDKNGAIQNTSAEILVVRKEWHTVLTQDGSSVRYVSQPEDKIISKQNIRVSGTTTNFMLNPDISGDYEIRIFVNGSNSYVRRKLYAWGWNDTRYSSFEVNNEGNVEIKAEKDKYEQGDNMNVLLTTPFDGKMLITVERDHILKYFYVTTKNKSASISLKTDESYLPNVYVTATLFRPMDGSDMPLTVAHGFKSIPVENKENQMTVKISAVEKSRSKTKQTISLKTTPNAFVTLAAVDEGILQIKNFVTPDPYKYFYQKVALSVNSFDIYPWLLPEIKSLVSSTGGDGAENSGLRVNPMFVNRVKLVSFWSGIVQADGSGNVKYDIDIPQFSGDIRVMAYTYKGKSFGSAEQHIKVADPIVISTALPRFLSPKDEVVMPISISNTTAKEANAIVTVKVSGPLGIVGEQTQNVKIAANREGRAVFNINAQAAIGAGNVSVTVKALGETFTNETDISVRPPASLQKITGNGYAEENTSTVIDLKNNFIPSSVNGKLTIGKSPLTQFTKHLDDLIRYPYGCVEQTTSAAFPQLYFSDLVKSTTGIDNKDMNPAYNVQQAINKLQSMQLNNGALSYWPGGGYESWWGSVYATHFLLEARKAGYAVNNNTVDRLMEYMKYKLMKKEVVNYWYNGTLKKEITPEEVPYSLYVLAMGGQAQHANMNYYKAHPELLTLGSKYLLAAAFSLSGQSIQARDILPPAFTGERAERSFDGSFCSFIRDEALSLNVLMDIDPTNKQVGFMAKELSENVRKERYLTTQENVFTLLALGKVAKNANKTTSTATVLAGGKTIGSTTGQATTLNMKNYANGITTVKVNGKGGYYYSYELAGISIDGSFKEEDSHLKVRRTFFDRTGKEVSNNVHQNDLIIVRLSIQTDNVDVENVAITDMLPAGFEIENTRLTEMPNMSWIKDEAHPYYKDVRDDRINMFTTVTATRKDYYYMVRAVSPGVYQLGPVMADAMYDGDYHSYNGAGIIKISTQ